MEGIRYCKRHSLALEELYSFVFHIFQCFFFKIPQNCLDPYSTRLRRVECGSRGMFTKLTGKPSVPSLIRKTSLKLDTTRCVVFAILVFDTKLVESAQAM